MKEKLHMLENKIAKQKRILLMISCIMIVALACLFMPMFFKKNWDAQKIVKEMAETVPGLTMIEQEVQEPETLPDGMISTASFKDIVITTEDNLHTFAGCIEVFNNHQEAMLRKEYLELLSEKIVSEISQANFGTQLCVKYNPGKEYIYINCNVLLRLDSQYSSYQAEQMSKSFHQVLENDQQTEKNIPDAAILEERKKNFDDRANETAQAYKNQLLENLDKEISALSDKIDGANLDDLLSIIEKADSYKSVPLISQKAVDVITQAQAAIQVVIDEINDGLAYARDVLEQAALDDVKDKIDALDHAYYNSYKTDWNQEVADIQWLINEKIIREYKAQCSAYEYDDLLDDINSYIGAYAYFRGKVVEVTETSSGRALRVNVTPIYSYFSDTILYWEDSIYVVLDDEISALVNKDNLVEMWGVIDGVTTHSTLFGGDQTVLQFNCRYLALN